MKLDENPSSSPPSESVSVVTSVATSAGAISAWFKGVVWAAGLLIAAFLAGVIGFRNGFVDVAGIPELQRDISSAISDGVRMIIGAPARVFDAGLHAAGPWLVAILTAILAALCVTVTIVADHRDADANGAAPASPRRPSMFDILGAVVCGLVSIITTGWVLARGRDLVADSMPWGGSAMTDWLSAARVTAGLDVIGLVSAILWFVFACRIRPAMWLRILTLVAAAISLIAVFIAGSISSGLVSHLDVHRTVFVSQFADVNADPSLLLGHTPTHLVVVRPDGAVVFEPAGADSAWRIVARRSLAEFLMEIRNRPAPHSDAHAEPSG